MVLILVIFKLFDGFLGHGQIQPFHCDNGIHICFRKAGAQLDGSHDILTADGLLVLQKGAHHLDIAVRFGQGRLLQCLFDGILYI